MSNTRIQVEALLGALFILLSSGLLVYEGFKEQTSLEETEISQNAKAIEAGAAIFGDACAECHNTDGKGLIGPPLNDPHLFDTGPNGRMAEIGWSGTLEDYIVSVISAGRPISTQPEYPGKLDGSYAMPAWGEAFGGPLRPDQVRDLMAFIMNFETEATGSVLVVRDEPIIGQTPEDRGRAVFAANGCGACHVIEGNSIAIGLVGPDLTNIGAEAAGRVSGQSAEDYILESIVDPAAFMAPDCPNGACLEPTQMVLTFGETISEENLSNLVAYLLSLGASEE